MTRNLKIKLIILVFILLNTFILIPATAFNPELINNLELTYNENISKSKDSISAYIEKVMLFNKQVNDKKKADDHAYLKSLINTQLVNDLLNLHNKNLEDFKNIKDDLDILIIIYKTELEEILTDLDDDEPKPKIYYPIEQLRYARNSIEKCHKEITGIIMDMTLYSSQPDASAPEKIKINDLVTNGEKLKKLYKRLPEIIKTLRAALI
jgi:hypothetical protein